MPSAVCGLTGDWLPGWGVFYRLGALRVGTAGDLPLDTYNDALRGPSFEFGRPRLQLDERVEPGTLPTTPVSMFEDEQRRS